MCRDLSLTARLALIAGGALLPATTARAQDTAAVQPAVTAPAVLRPPSRFAAARMDAPRLASRGFLASHAAAWQAPSRTPVLLPPDELRRLSQHAGWGMAIGGAAGAVYGLTADREAAAVLLGLPVLLDAAAGAAIGLVGGSVVYLVRSAARR